MNIKKIALPLFFFFFLPNSIFAQTLGERLSKQVNENYGDRFSFIEVLSMENVTPKASQTGVQTYVIEISIQGKAKLRIPAKISRNYRAWKVDWIAKKEYVQALDNVANSGKLGSLKTRVWDKVSRLPAFPVLLTSRIITPFGVLDAPTPGEKFSPMSLHASRWINQILLGDQAPAAFEIITPAKTTWAAIHNVMLELAGLHGLFQMYLVGANIDGVLSSMILRTTVGAQMPTRIISLARGDAFDGVHVVVKNEKGIREVTPLCPSALPEGKYCSPRVEPIPKIMEVLFSKPLEKNERILLGFSKAIRIQDVFTMVAGLSEKLEISSERFLVTLVEE